MYIPVRTNDDVPLNDDEKVPIPKGPWQYVGGD